MGELLNTGTAVMALWLAMSALRFGSWVQLDTSVSWLFATLRVTKRLCTVWLRACAVQPRAGGRSGSSPARRGPEELPRVRCG